MILITLLIIFFTVLAGYFSRYFIKSTEDFFIPSNGMGVFSLTGMLMGAIIGGASTVGTSQMAYERGVGAIWFTFGLVIASISLNIVYGHLLDKDKKPSTLTGIIGDHYGDRARLTASVILILGMFIHINGQVIASVSVLYNMLPFNVSITVFLTVLVIMLYVIFGGFWGSTVVGSIKTILLYLSAIIIGVVLISRYDIIHSLGELKIDGFWNPFSKGFFKDLSLPLSTVLGVLSTQIYFQTSMAAKDRKTLRRTGYLTAFLIMPVGIVSVLIGLFMKLNHPEIIARDSFMLFTQWYLSPVIGGVAIAAVVISSVATAAGLMLGITTILIKDVFIVKKDQTILKITRLTILILSMAVYIIVVNLDDSMILNWGFLSMVFRATPILIPVGLALYKSSEIKASPMYILIGPLLSLIWIVSGLDSISSIYIGVLGAIFYHLLVKQNLKDPIYLESEEYQFLKEKIGSSKK
jgi:SSS family solute:Na+ symporter